MFGGMTGGVSVGDLRKPSREEGTGIGGLDVASGNVEDMDGGEACDLGGDLDDAELRGEEAEDRGEVPEDKDAWRHIESMTSMSPRGS